MQNCCARCKAPSAGVFPWVSGLLFHFWSLDFILDETENSYRGLFTDKHICMNKAGILL